MIVLLVLMLTFVALAGLFAAAHEGASENVQVWLPLLAGLARGTTVWAAVKAVRDEEESVRSRYGERGGREQRQRWF